MNRSIACLEGVVACLFSAAAVACVGMPRIVTLESTTDAGIDASNGDAASIQPPPQVPPDDYLDAGSLVEVGYSDTLTSEKASIDAQIEATRGMSQSTLLARYPSSLVELDTDPTQAIGLDTIQQSDLGLNADELKAFQTNGLVISARQQFPNFTYGYESIYASHLPLFISADSILFAVHRSFDTILSTLETDALVNDLKSLLSAMRQALNNVNLPDSLRADEDLYLTVAHGLLTGQTAIPAAGADPTQVQRMFALCNAASGIADVNLFGVKRYIDFSQFQPRGHYTESTQLKGYFRAMTWLSRIDFRLIDTLADGSRVFRRRQLEATVGLRQLVSPTILPYYTDIDRVVSAFVGEHDSMTLAQVDSLLGDLGVTDLAGLADFSDSELANAIVRGGYGMQRIASDYMVSGTAGTLPLSASFALFGQRFTPDSNVFSNVVYDRVLSQPLRLMPNPLDVSFAALGNNFAATLLEPELTRYAYAEPLAAMRVLADSYPGDFWQGSLYNLWLSALRQLSPGAETSNPKAVGLPTIAGTDAWQRRLANTQLASWAELRHDTLLYTKQSYSGASLCEFPDAYVEPYPQFFQALADYADRGQQLLSNASTQGAVDVTQYFQHLSQVAQMLGAMAQNERTGTPHSAEQLAFVNQTVYIQRSVCTGAIEGAGGWYPELFYDQYTLYSTTQGVESTIYDPTIADVHTQPTDAAGNPVGRVLHVGTGPARLMIASIDTCSGPRAYAGLVSSYFEVITDNWQRLTDEQWISSLTSGTPAEAPWLQSIVAR